MDRPPLTIYNLQPMPPTWDWVGIFYITFCATWTTIIVAGMAFCWYNRHLPMLRVRGLPLAFAAVTLLHLYWIMAQITYPIGATMPVVIAYDVQYFVMGTWFPMGIALFHASNLRFLRVAKLQRQFAQQDLTKKKAKDGGRISWTSRIRDMDYDTKVMAFIVIGMVFQTLLTAGMWAACKKYHPSFGFPGTEIRGATLPEQLRDLGIGWEWWPSVVWQFVWTWGVAPVMIWKSWNIRDTMGWRTQTIGACLSGLHATPMFLIASYAPAFSKINVYFYPSQWIHLHTMFLESFLVFIPAYQIIRQWHTTRRVAYCNSKWQASEATTICATPPSFKASSSINLVEKDHVFPSLSPDAQYTDDLLTMTALNRVLADHPTPLQEFSAYSDFSGENIAFLTRVAGWKARCVAGEDDRRELFNGALRIYVDYVSLRDADFPLNLSSQLLRELECCFEEAARVVCGHVCVDTVVPFAFDGPSSDDDAQSDRTFVYERYVGAVSEIFGMGVFDEAEAHVKHLVLTNTWPKFVREMQLRRWRSEESERSDGSDGTVVSRVRRFVRSLV